MNHGSYWLIHRYHRSIWSHSMISPNNPQIFRVIQTNPYFILPIVFFSGFMVIHRGFPWENPSCRCLKPETCRWKPVETAPETCRWKPGDREKGEVSRGGENWSQQGIHVTYTMYILYIYMHYVYIYIYIHTLYMYLEILYYFTNLN